MSDLWEIFERLPKLAFVESELLNAFLGPVCAISWDPLRGYCVESRRLFISLRHQAGDRGGRVWWACTESARPRARARLCIRVEKQRLVVACKEDAGKREKAPRAETSRALGHHSISTRTLSVHSFS